MPRGGKREGAGRKPGSVTKISDSSIKKLNELGLDPIDILNKELKAIKGKDDFRSRNLRVRIAEKLLEYGYKRQPVSIEQSGDQNVPMLTIIKKQPEEIKKVVDAVEKIEHEAEEK